MEQTKHTVIFEFIGMKTTAYWTQSELADRLKNPELKLISVNSEKSGYRRNYRKRK